MPFIVILLAAGLAVPQAQIPGSAPSQRQPDAVVIEAAKKTIVQVIEPKLPKITFDEWLRGVVGAKPEMKWGVNDCGEQTGNPASDRGRDFPMCAEVRVVLGPKHELMLSLAMGTFGKGLTGKPPVLWMGLLTTPDGKQQWIKTLGEVPTLVGRKAPRPQGYFVVRNVLNSASDSTVTTARMR